MHRRTWSPRRRCVPRHVFRPSVAQPSGEIRSPISKQDRPLEASEAYQTGLLIG